MNRKTNGSSLNKRKTRQIQNQNQKQMRLKITNQTQPNYSFSNLLNFSLLLQNGKSIEFVLEKQKPMSQLVKCLHEAYRRSFNHNSKKLIGFTSLDEDYINDYKLSLQIGEVTQSKNYKCLFQSNESGIVAYKVHKCLASGGFSKVYLVRSLKNGTFYAAKFIQKSMTVTEQKKALILNEININKNLNHPSLAKMHQSFQTENFYVLIMDYCSGGELFNQLKMHKRYTQSEAKIYFIQILLGIEYLHQKRIVYRDLKPENIIIDSKGHTKIADFGLAKYCRERLYSYCGSIEYMAPQIIGNKGHSYEVDYYCMGALLYELLIGCPPFYNPDLKEDQTKYNIMNSKVQFPSSPILSRDVKSLILKLLEKNPKHRLGHYLGVKEIFCHPWIGKINKEQYLKQKISPPYQPNLNILNFDQSDVGKSQRRFTNKVISEIIRKSAIIEKKQNKVLSSSQQKINKSQQNYLSVKDSLSPSFHKLSSTLLNRNSSIFFNRNSTMKRFKTQNGQFIIKQQSNLTKKKVVKKINKCRFRSNENMFSSENCQTKKKVQKVEKKLNKNSNFDKKILKRTSICNI